MPLSHDSHSMCMLEIISKHTTVPVRLLELPETIGGIAKTINSLFEQVCPIDIIVCPWAIPGNSKIDNLFTELAELCWVVAAAGNTGELIDGLTPARVKKVITVGSLNKSGKKATHSNFSNTKQLEWVTGTNYQTSVKLMSGTSVSSVIYASFLAESFQAKNTELVEILINKLKVDALAELGATNMINRL